MKVTTKRRRSPHVFSLPRWDGPHILQVVHTRNRFWMTLYGHIGLTAGKICMRRLLEGDEIDAVVARLAGALDYETESVDGHVAPDVFVLRNPDSEDGGISLNLEHLDHDRDITAKVFLPRKWAQELLEWLAPRAGWDLVG